LNSLETFGFRGEALPSIASVSKFTMITGREVDCCGSEIVASGGNVLEAKEVSPLRGTRIVVENLFFNVPARRKFLKSDETEGGHIISLVKHLALAENGIKFSLFQSGNRIFTSPTAHSCGERVNEIFKLREKFIDFSCDGDGISAHGAICDPTFGNVCRKNIVLFVNRRLVKSDFVNAVLCNELVQFFPNHRGIVAHIFLQIRPNMIDVNVHPMKREVRFRNQQNIADFIRTCVANIFESTAIAVQACRTPIMERAGPFATHPMSNVPNGKITLRGGGTNYKDKFTNSSNWRYSLGDVRKAAEILSAKQENLPSEAINGTFWRFIGTTFGEVALFECATGIIVFNVRLAARRVAYERLLGEDCAKNSQRLLMPIEISVSHGEVERVDRFLPILSRYGFSMYSFGKCDYKIDAIPPWLSYGEAEVAILELIASGERTKHLDAGEALARGIALSVNSEKYKTQSDIEELRDHLLNCKNPLLSPDGNAVYFEIPLADIDRRFAPNLKP
jgi:DNA mismatch repair protein MutL